ncbi:hypothetical protein GDO78_022425 [Eleutherodactylus coqui]|uniref:Uncharacterized protein n=1 Tax=Eleutherodactylus coqui TaxID=57060 RepID=A0A8J6AYE3_ELECQ|nr:hypothetical protein GDO78_022425 [Eleutherodactylus coqui]
MYGFCQNLQTSSSIIQQVFPSVIQGADGSLTICTYPFVFDAQAKTTLLQTDAVIQMQMAIDQANRQNFSSMFLPVVESVDPCLILIVRRDNIVGDAMEVLRKTKNIDYKKPLKVKYEFRLFLCIIQSCPFCSVILHFVRTIVGHLCG